MMHLRGFKQEVKKLSRGKYHSAQHRITESGTGGIVHYWSAYIEDVGWTKDYNSPGEALRGLINLRGIKGRIR